MISKGIKKFILIGFVLIIIVALIPVTIHFARPKIFKNKFAQIRSEQLALQAQRKPIRNAPSPTPSRATNIPGELKLTVPFTAQAPTANWDELHNEACEEASVIMANAYFTGITSLPSPSVENEITKLTNWQKQNYGYYLSITTDETIKMIEDVYSLQAETTTISEQAIKKALNENKLVILPADGRLLKNPNFRPPGPVYHMLVITGYDKDSFITNDPGTRKGKDYRYSYETLYEAAGSYSHAKHEVDLSQKEIIIVSK